MRGILCISFTYSKTQRRTLQNGLPKLFYSFSILWYHFKLLKISQHRILFQKKSFKIFQTFLNGFELGLFTTVFIEIMRFKVFLYTHYIKNLMSIINYTQIHNYINYIINKCFDNLKNWLYLRIFFNFIIVHILIVLVSLCNVSLSLSHS